jgi:tetratricopeptide (TPR) repeat protein
VPSGRAEDTQAVPVELIIASSLPDAQDIQQRIQNGEDFAALAKERSIDPSANNAGYMGSVDPETLRIELREALRTAAPGQITGIVKIPAGFAILKRLKEAPNSGGNANDHERLLAVSSLSSARLTHDASGYAEMLTAVRNRIPANGEWGMDLKAVCAARRRAPLEGIAGLRKELERQGTDGDPAQLSFLHATIAGLLASLSEIDGALDQWEEAYRQAARGKTPELAHNMDEVLAVGYLRRALNADQGVHGAINETELIPMHPGSAHEKREDVEKAIQHLTKATQDDPSDYELRWLLNLAHMTAGSYPAAVPRQFLIPPSAFTSTEDLGLFLDVAPAAGVDVYGTAGGAIVEDFENNGLLDIVTSGMDDCQPLHFYHNNANGTFTDRAAEAGLSDQTGGLNIIQADYNNDGCVDILVMRGGWEFPRRRSLLRNNCDGTFTDVTAQSGLLEPLRSSQTAVWVDIDNDGYLDLFIGNEDAPAQLFLNRGNGTFVDIAREAGVDRTAFTKSVVSADYDNDGYPDLYVSNYNGRDFLYHNNHDRTFTEVSSQAGVEQAPWMSFGACFLDYDNDGWPDLFVTGYFFSVEESARSYLNLPRKAETLKMFKNMKDGTFRDVTAELGLDRIFMPMGFNFGDIDNDGFLDIYMGMGNPSYATLLPNTLLHNQDGKRFADISTSSGTGAISKGHGVAFADLGNNGNEDIVIVMGGPTVGDRNSARLFENPGGHGNDWIALKLTGVKSNRGAIGARIAVTVVDADRGRRQIVRTVGSGGSFGASPLEQHIGLGRAAKIENIEVWWPTSKTRQNFTNIEPNQFLEIKEFEPKPLRLTRLSYRLGGAALQQKTNVPSL